MSIARIATQNQPCSASAPGTTLAITQAYPANVAAGSLITAVGTVSRSGASPMSSVTLSKNGAGGAAITGIGSLIGTTGYDAGGYAAIPFILYAYVTSAGALTVDISCSHAGAWMSAVLDEFSGVGATPLDVNGGEITGTTTGGLQTDSITTGVAGDLIIGVMGTWESATWYGSDLGFTDLLADSYYGISPNNSKYKIVTTPGAYTIDWKYSAAGSYVYSILDAAFKGPTAAAVPQATHHYAMLRG